MNTRKTLPPPPKPDEVMDPKASQSLTEFLEYLLTHVPNLTPAHLARVMGVRGQDIYGYRRNGKIPSAEKVKKLAIWASVSFGDLLEMCARESEPRVQPMAMDSFSTMDPSQRIAASYERMTDEAKKLFEQLSETLPKKQE